MNGLQIRLREALADAAARLKNDAQRLKVPFPRGWIRTLAELKPRWPYLSNPRARTVACAIQLCDVNRLFLSVFEVSLTAGAMWEWHVTVPVIAVIETLCYEVVQSERWGGRDVKFEKCINVLHSRGVFKHPFQNELHELRMYRNEVHLYLKDKVPMADGKPRPYNRAVRALKGVESRLLRFYKLPGRTAGLSSSADP